MKKIHKVLAVILLIGCIILVKQVINIDRYVGINFSDDMQYLNEVLIDIGTEILADGKYEEIPDDELLEKINEADVKVNRILKSVHSYKDLNSNYDVDITSASFILSKVTKKIMREEGLTEADKESLSIMVELNRDTYELIRSSYYIDDRNIMTEMKLPSFVTDYINKLNAIEESL